MSRTVTPLAAVAARDPEALGCPHDRCDGSGFLLDEETNTTYDCSCRPQRRAVRRSRALSRTIPQRYRNLSWDRHPVPGIERENPFAVSDVRAYCETIGEQLDRGRGLWLYGPKGTGKTTLAMLISEHALRARRAVAIYSTSDLLNEIRATYDADARRTTLELVESLAAVDLLHLEDLAVPRPTDWVLEQLYTVVNRRYEDERAIVFTSDVRSPAAARGGGASEEPSLPDPERLADFVGERTYSRLVEMCGDPLLLGGSDHRIDHAPPGAP